VKQARQGLPRPKGAAQALRVPAATISHYVNAACSAATRRAYAADVGHFMAAGYRVPCRDTDVAAYLAECGASLAPATLRRRLVAIQRAHVALGKPSPVTSPLVKTVMRGIVRSRGAVQRRVKAVDKALLCRLLKVVDATATTTLARVRNRALLLLGFAGAFRRSELVAINVGDLAIDRGGLLVTVRRSKTDQQARGRTVPIPRAQGPYCPVRALQHWLRCSGIDRGPVFRPIDRYGHVSAQALSGQRVATVVKVAVAAVGLDPREFAGHSLRVGYVTTATVANQPLWQIKQVTGHRSDDVVAGYVRLAGPSRPRSLL